MPVVVGLGDLDHLFDFGDVPVELALHFDFARRRLLQNISP